MSLILSDYDVINYEAGADNDLRGKECQGCRRLLEYKFYDLDSSYKDGRKPLCGLCIRAPKMSMSEHTARLREMNYNSEGTRRQRHEDQDLFRQDRKGRMMEASLFLEKLLKIYPSLYVTQGGVVGDLALYATSGTARPDWNGQTFRYMGYITLGVRPEFSEYEFDNSRNVMIRVSNIGWRSVLLRFVENNILTEKQCLAEFGPPSGGENSTWFKSLYKARNRKI